MICAHWLVLPQLSGMLSVVRPGGRACPIYKVQVVTINTFDIIIQFLNKHNLFYYYYYKTRQGD